MSKETSKNSWLTILRNNAISIALHAAVSLVYFFIVYLLTAIPDSMGVDIIVLVIVLLGFAFAVGGYVILSFLYLRPVAQGNALSVALLPIGLVAVFIAAGFLSSNAIWFDGHFDYEVVTSLAAMTNSPATFTAGVLSSPIDSYSEFTPLSLLLSATLVPSLLMYVGLRLKLSHETKAAITSESEKA